MTEAVEGAVSSKPEKAWRRRTWRSGQELQPVVKKRKHLCSMGTGEIIYIFSYKALPGHLIASSA